MATLGSVFTNTRNGTSALASSGDQAMATPSATPTAPAIRKAPTISQVVTQRCCAQLTSPCHSEFQTESGEGRRYSRIPPKLTAICQAASSVANSATVGQYWRLNAFIFAMICPTFNETDEGPIGRQDEAPRGSFPCAMRWSAGFPS